MNLHCTEKVKKKMSSTSKLWRHTAEVVVSWN